MEITNEKLKLTFQIIFNKNMDKITPEDLQSLESISINSQGLSPEETELNVLETMKHCPNLKEISFIYTFITKKILEVLSTTNIKKITFDNSAFEDEKAIHLPESVTYLKMNKCFLDNYDNFLKQLPSMLEILYINYPSDESTIHISLLNQLKKLQKVVLDGCIVDFNNIDLQECDYLSLLGTSISEKAIEDISHLQKLKKFYISKKYNELKGIKGFPPTVEIKNDLSEYVYDDEEL